MERGGWGRQRQSHVSHTAGHRPTQATEEDEAKRVTAPQDTDSRTMATPGRRPRQELQKCCAERRKKREGREGEGRK